MHRLLPIALIAIALPACSPAPTEARDVLQVPEDKGVDTGPVDKCGPERPCPGRPCVFA